MPWTSITARPETAERLKAQAARFGRSRSDLIEALSLLADQLPSATEAFLTRVKQLQPTQGTGRRARRTAKIEASEEKSK
jgi:hypothetical protein